MFLANENIPLKSIKILRENGYNIKAIIEELAGISDEEVLRIAKKENRIILTFDRDYGKLVFREKKLVPGGIIYFRFTPTYPEECGEILLRILSFGNIQFKGMFTIVERTKIRQKKLKI
jgi:predicted nuclease of predicted toxin-antitoxin system